MRNDDPPPEIFDDTICFNCGRELQGGTLSGPEDRVRDRGYCSATCAVLQEGLVVVAEELGLSVLRLYEEEKLLVDIFALARHVDGVDVSGAIGQRLYRATSCGVALLADQAGVAVYGYCEGVDCDFPEHRVTFPFSGKDFDAAVQAADDDGIRIWDETHGCICCVTESDSGGKPVDPDCPLCAGQGVPI